MKLKNSFCEWDSYGQAFSRQIPVWTGETPLPQAYNRYQDSPHFLFSPRLLDTKCACPRDTFSLPAKEIAGLSFLSSFRGDFGPRPPIYCSWLFSPQVFPNYTHLFITSPLTRRFLWGFPYNHIMNRNLLGNPSANFKMR